MNRRGFLGAILAAGVAPAVVRSESLMQIWMPPALETAWDQFSYPRLLSNEKIIAIRSELMRSAVASKILVLDTPKIVTAGDKITFRRHLPYAAALPLVVPKDTFAVSLAPSLAQAAPLLPALRA